MTPLEKAKAEEGRVNCWDECESFQIVGNAAYCKVDGKLIHPIMMMRGQGTCPAWNCHKRNRPLNNYYRLIRSTPEELAKFLAALSDPEWHIDGNIYDSSKPTVEGWLGWLRQEVDQ